MEPTNCEWCGGWIHHGVEESKCLICCRKPTNDTPRWEPKAGRLRPGGDYGTNNPFTRRSRPKEQTRKRYDNRLGRRTK